MRILCRHGFFSFYPESDTDLARFCSRYEINLVKMRDFYTFPFLATTPDFSIKGAPLLNIVSTKTFEGNPWDVMRENKVVYNIQTELLAPISTVVSSVQINQASYNYIVESPLIQPGSRDERGALILSYDAHFDFDLSRIVLRNFWNE